MAKVKQISVSAEFKKGLPNYSNVTFVAGAVLEVEEGDNLKKCYERAWDMVGGEIATQLKDWEEDQKAGARKGL